MEVTSIRVTTGQREPGASKKKKKRKVRDVLREEARGVGKTSGKKNLIIHTCRRDAAGNTQGATAARDKGPPQGKEKKPGSDQTGFRSRPLSAYPSRRPGAAPKRKVIKKNSRLPLRRLLEDTKNKEGGNPKDFHPRRPSPNPPACHIDNPRHPCVGTPG